MSLSPISLTSVSTGGVARERCEMLDDPRIDVGAHHLKSSARDSPSASSASMTAHGW